MAIQKIVTIQRDFSAGEVDPDLKRRDDQDFMKSGARLMLNHRINHSGSTTRRPGRRGLFLVANGGRVDEVFVLPGVIYRFVFGGDGSLFIRDANGAQVATTLPVYPWATITIDQIVWTQVKTGPNASDIVITFPGMTPLVARFDGVNWTFPAFSFTLGADGIPLVPFYRIATPGITMQITAAFGIGPAVNIGLLTSAPVFIGAHVNALFRYANKRVRITGVINSTQANAVTIDALLPSQNVEMAGAADINGFSLGQLVQGNQSNCNGVIVDINRPLKIINVQILNYASGFVVGEQCVGPTQNSAITAVSAGGQGQCTVWDEQIIGDARGWPRSCSSDQGRLIFSDLPAVPEAILWSVFGLPYDFNNGPQPTDAMTELIAGKPRVYHVIPGTGEEMVFTDRGVWAIPINENNPLKPGSVVFRPVTPEASSKTRPIFTTDGFVYVGAGQNRIIAVRGTGMSQATRPYSVDDITLYHKHLFTTQPKGLALYNGDGQLPERYLFVVNRDGSIVTGRYDPAKQWLGWNPWFVPGGSHNWVSCLQSNIVFTTVYSGAGYSNTLAEQLDTTVYLDAAVAINNIPNALNPPPGQGPFPWLPNGRVDLMDGLRLLGTYVIDATGHVLPNSPGEDLTSPTLIGGQPFTSVLQPFVPNAEGGQSSQQRLRRRRISRAAVSVQGSTGFRFWTLYEGRAGYQLPVKGSIIQTKLVPPWNAGDNQSLDPPLREETYTFRPRGHSYDPGIAVAKDMGGPLTIVEIAMEVSI